MNKPALGLTEQLPAIVKLLIANVEAARPSPLGHYGGATYEELSDALYVALAAAERLRLEQRLKIGVTRRLPIHVDA